MCCAWKMGQMRSVLNKMLAGVEGLFEVGMGTSPGVLHW